MGSDAYRVCYLGIVHQVCSELNIVSIQKLELHSLYTRAIRYALARRLASSVSLHTVLAGFKIAGPSWLRSTRQPLWMIGSLLCFLAVNSQTAGYRLFLWEHQKHSLTAYVSRYTTLLTPKVIVVKSNMVGYELDLKSPDFQTLFAANTDRVTAGM